MWQVVLLMWGESQRDMEMAAKILSQVCLAYQGDRGTTVAVLSQLEKLAMESHFRRVLPDASRLGSRPVFRQGVRPCACGRVCVRDCHWTMPCTEKSRHGIRMSAYNWQSCLGMNDRLPCCGFIATRSM